MVFTTTNRAQVITSILFATILIVTFAVYFPGVSGDFVFDDAPNLSSLAKYTDFSTWENFQLFILEGRSGPTGRPISLASFYLNDIAWPSQATGFILTNIMIHLLNGVMVFIFTSKLASSLKFSHQKTQFIALFSTAIWLLHPFNSTTVLYVIQRMTELSSLFMLLGLIFYMVGRDQLHNRKLGFVTLFLGVGSSLLLAILSKENGILLVTYILAIEYFLFRPLGNKPPVYFNYWLIPSIIIPFFIIIIYLGYVSLHTGGYLSRNFSFTERLLTEPRILFDYIYNIILPKISGTGLYQDDFMVSKGLFSPWTTLPAILSLIALSAYSIFSRKKTPFIAFAIVWFFSGHLLESTVIALELYFEHRNYLPMLGILIAIAYYIEKLSINYRLASALIISLVIGILSFLTYEKSHLWGKPVELLANWSYDHPTSVRAQGADITRIQMQSSNENSTLDNQIETVSKLSANTALWSLAYTCDTQQITHHYILSTIETLRHKTIRTEAGNGLDQFTHAWFAGKCPYITSQNIESFFQQMITLGERDHNTVFVLACHDALARLYKKNRDLGKTMAQLEISYNIKPRMTTLLEQSHNLASAGLYKEALAKLEDTQLLRDSFKKRLIFNITRKRIDALRSEILSSMRMHQVSTNNNQKAT